MPHIGESPHSQTLHIKVTENGVQKLLKGLNPHKTSGPDIISTMFLGTTAALITPTLTMLFQTSIDQGTITDDWKLAFVTPIFKKRR